MIAHCWKATYNEALPDITIHDKNSNDCEYDPHTQRVCSIEEYEVVQRMRRKKHIIIENGEYTTLKRKGSIYDSIKTITSYESASSCVTPHSMHLIAAFAVSNPQISPRNIQALVTLSRYTLLYDIQAHSRYKHDFITLRNIHKISPCESTIDNYVPRLAAMQVITTRLSVPPTAKLFVQTDGGHQGQEVRLLSYYNQRKNKIEVVWLGLTYCGKDSGAVARGLRQSLVLWFDYNRLIAGTTGDSGSGTPESLGKACSEIGITEPLSQDHSCGLHDCSSVFRPTIEKMIGKGGLDSDNAVQLLHTIYSLYYELRYEWKKLITDVYLAENNLPQDGSVKIPSALVLAMQEPLHTR